MANTPDRGPGQNDKNLDVSKEVKITLIAKVVGLLTVIVKMIDTLLHLG